MVYEHNQGFQVYDIKDGLPSGVKTLKEARGRVVNDDQTQILKNLRLLQFWHQN